MRLVREGINWRYAVGEFLLVIAGILVALGIDAYVASQGEERTAERYVDQLATEMMRDSVYFRDRREQLEGMRVAATVVLAAVQTGQTTSEDLAAQLMSAVRGEQVPRDPVVWEEIRASGNLTLIDEAIRTRLVGHFLDRAAALRVIDENFAPAVRALRALAWDILPVETFRRFFISDRTGIPSDPFLGQLTEREDAEFLLKRLIVTTQVAQRQLLVIEAFSSRLARDLVPGVVVPDDVRRDPAIDVAPLGEQEGPATPAEIP